MTEPGHHYEWIWLLRSFAGAASRNVEFYCGALYDHADRYGWDAQGFVVDEVDAIGNGAQAIPAMLAAHRMHQGEHRRRRTRTARLRRAGRARACAGP